MNSRRARLCQPGRTAAKVFSLAVLVAGLAVLMYPAVSKWYATSTHAQAVTEYSLHQPDSAFSQFETARQANEVGISKPRVKHWLSSAATSVHGFKFQPWI